MKNVLRKKLGKESDLLITLAVGISFWKLDHHKTLILSWFFPNFKISNWSGKWLVKGRKLGIGDQDILDDLFHYDRIGEKYTVLE